MIKKMTGKRQTKYKRLSQRCVNNKKGVSLVGVIVAFLLLMIIMLMLKDDIEAQRGLAIWLYDKRPTAQEVMDIWVKNYLDAHPQEIRIEGQDEK